MSCARWLAGKFDSLTAGEGLRAIAHENNGRGPASERFGEFGTEQVKRVAFEAVSYTHLTLPTIYSV